jgi:hypothetical protein
VFFLLLSACVTFLPEEVIVGFRNFAWGFKSQKKIVGKKKLGDQFLGFFVKDEKCLELPEMSRKLIGQFFCAICLSSSPPDRLPAPGPDPSVTQIIQSSTPTITILDKNSGTFLGTTSSLIPVSNFMTAL